MSAPAPATNVRISLVDAQFPRLDWVVGAGTEWIEIYRTLPGDNKSTLRAGPNGRGKIITTFTDRYQYNLGLAVMAGRFFRTSPNKAKYTVFCCNADGASPGVSAEIELTSGGTLGRTPMPVITAYTACDNGWVCELALTETFVTVPRSVQVAKASMVRRAGKHLLVGEYGDHTTGVLTKIDRSTFNVSATHSDPRLARVLDCVVEGNLAYVTSQTAGAEGVGCLSVVDLQSRDAVSGMSVIGAVADQWQQGTQPICLCKWNNYVFTGANGSQTLNSVDVTDPTKPVIFKNAQVWYVGEGPVRLLLRYPHVFVTCDHGSISRWDIRNPANYWPDGIIGGDYYSRTLEWCSPTELFTLSLTGRIEITDVGNRVMVRKRPHLQLPEGKWRNAIIVGNRAYCLGVGKIAIVDIADAPRLVGVPIEDERWGTSEPLSPEGQIIL